MSVELEVTAAFLPRFLSAVALCEMGLIAIDVDAVDQGMTLTADGRDAAVSVGVDPDAYLAPRELARAFEEIVERGFVPVTPKMLAQFAEE